MHRDPGSPQARAYDWLKNDTLLSTVEGARQLQRFVLATFFYAMGGNDWYINTGWLDHNAHECSWYAKLPEPLTNSTSGSCDDQGHMTANGLVGSIPPEVTLLTSLQYFGIATNEVGG